MKNYLIILSLLIGINVSGQTEKNQSITLNLLGLQYGYEIPAGKSTTVLLQGGIAGELGYSTSWFAYNNDLVVEETWFGSLRGTIASGFRYYYNLDKRAEKGRNTRNNSANFWSLDVRYYTKGFYTYNMRSYDVIVFIPYWGIKRVYSNHWMIELNLGIEGVMERKEFELRPKFDFKVGYNF